MAHTLKDMIFLILVNMVFLLFNKYSTRIFNTLTVEIEMIFGACLGRSIHAVEPNAMNDLNPLYSFDERYHSHNAPPIYAIFISEQFYDLIL